jgi:hypothetical protein
MDRPSNPLIVSLVEPRIEPRIEPLDVRPSSPILLIPSVILPRHPPPAALVIPDREIDFGNFNDDDDEKRSIIGIYVTPVSQQ